MFVHYYMTADPLTIQPDMTVVEAYTLLQDREFRHLPVVDGDGVLQGMLTDRDLRSACPSSILEGEQRQKIVDQVKGTPVRAIMSTEFVSLQATSTLDDALLRFTSRSIGALPVVDSKGRVVGIFSLNDMMASWRSLFGLGEKGSMLVAIRDTGQANSLSRLVQALEEAKIDFTRLVRSGGAGGREPASIYLRVSTFNLSSVHRVVERAGFTVQRAQALKQDGKRENNAG